MTASAAGPDSCQSCGAVLSEADREPSLSLSWVQNGWQCRDSAACWQRFRTAPLPTSPHA